MRHKAMLPSAVSVLIGLALVVGLGWGGEGRDASRKPPSESDRQIARHAQRMLEEGRRIFRFDTFGSEDETVLTRREPVAEGTMAFHFARPAGFAHAAGQNVLVTLLEPPQTDSQGDSRTFTLASAPQEPELMVATRMRDSAFKRALKSAAAGTPVRIEGPNGLMVLHEDAAFLEELERLEQANPRYRLIATMTEAANSARPWN